MEPVRIIKWIGMSVILVASIIAAVFAILAYRNTNNPKKYVIEADEKFANSLYESFAGRLVKDPAFTTRAKEVLINAYV